ncbi:MULTISPECIES: glycerol-3-phosphate dehydrogenase/oxidase [Psychrilyobacter]|uniref:Uncharacterized protein n=1 Tax=Psychrilyobacter piezotolerans TaxID=2293438 RepID=A0ABX9KJD1_9FUSO|nr:MULTISPECIES: glycerol-3-phosphate dehydrogenase/oxidase [Psychrilyobacter]MCS5421232.1 glycerol-3-phosphate dehydrogenase/oxidase [Psychrilyobacter sp. S5]NDI77011.1 hypothetical protein [Psychrilyobacter piezotolerans]RDE64628.1 hypothetical protein DV867_03545 [Psychrilyobacter sp. S5]REI42440.1 hypothetical protein DYH56_03545 [Psychrilyobacter piezotolerans]
MKLRNDFKKILKSNAHYYGLTINKDDEIDDLMFKIINYKESIFTKSSYHLNYSKHFLKQLENLPKKYNDYLDNILNMLKNGDLNVNKFLTKQIKTTSFYDDFRILWGLYHLHIEKLIKGKAFSERSNYLLILYKNNSNIYLVDIVEHREPDLWYKKRFLEIIDNEWSDLLPVLQGTSGSDYNEKDIKLYRNSNINTVINVNGKAVMSTINGISTNGTPFQYVRESLYMKITLEKIEKYFQIDTAIYPHKFFYTFIKHENKNFYVTKNNGVSKQILIISLLEDSSYIKEIKINFDNDYLSMLFDNTISYVEKLF